MASKEIQLKAGDMLFDEGDQSKNLYFLKNGMIRIFKKKGDGAIEIETIRAGQVLGELAFFDNMPRSASAESLTAATLVEISQETLDDAVSKIPEWFSALIKTITSRLRNTNNRLRSLETVSTDYETDKYGNRSKEFTFVNTSELLRFCTALLTVASRYGKPSDHESIEFSNTLFEKFAVQILQVSASKVVSLLETFKKIKLIDENSKLLDCKFLDKLIQYLNDQNLVEPSKKRSLTEPAFKVMQIAMLQRSTAIKVSETMEKVNIAPHLASAGVTLNQAQELFDQGFVHSINMVSGNEAYLQYETQKFIFEFRVSWLLNEITKLNDSKRKGSTT